MRKMRINSSGQDGSEIPEMALRENKAKNAEPTALIDDLEFPMA